MQMSLKKAPPNEGDQKPKPKNPNTPAPRAGAIPRVVRGLTAILILVIWVVVVTPVWLFTVARTMVVYAVQSVLHIVKGLPGPATDRLDRVASLYPAGFRKAWWLGTGRGSDVVVNVGKAGLAKFVFDLVLTAALGLAVLWLLAPAPYAGWGPAILNGIIDATLDFADFVTDRVQALTAPDPDLPL